MVCAPVSTTCLSSVCSVTSVVSNCSPPDSSVHGILQARILECIWYLDQNCFPLVKIQEWGFLFVCFLLLFIYLLEHTVLKFCFLVFISKLKVGYIPSS